MKRSQMNRAEILEKLNESPPNLSSCNDKNLEDTGPAIPAPRHRRDRKYNHNLQARPVHLLALMSGALREHRVDLALEGRPRQRRDVDVLLLPEDLVHRRRYF